MARPLTRPVPGEYAVDFGTVHLLEDADVESRWLLALDGTPQSYVDLDDPTHLEFAYIRHLACCIDVLAPAGPLRAIHLGGGGATLARWIHHTRPGSRQLVLERDAALVECVRSQLGLPKPPAVKMKIGDARESLTALEPARADVLIHDVFAGGSTPAHVTSIEFWDEVRRVVAPGALVLANVADGRGLRFARAQVATLADRFADVAVVAYPGVLASRRFGNLVLLASDSPLDAGAVRKALSAEPLPVRVVDGDDVRRFAGGAVPVTDALAVPSPQIPP